VGLGKAVTEGNIAIGKHPIPICGAIEAWFERDPLKETLWGEVRELTTTLVDAELSEWLAAFRLTICFC